MDPIIASEDTVEIPLTPERIHPKDATTSRRNSTGRVSTSSSGDKILPNYLRASTNSCHDLCKYGGHHAFEAKERYPIPKRFAAVASKFQIPALSVTLQERKKKLELKPKPLAEPKTQAPDKLTIVKRDIEIVTREVSSPSKQINVAAKLANVSKPPLSPLKKLDVTPKPATGLKPKPVTVNLPSSPLTSSSRSRRNSDIGIASNTISRRSNSDVGIVNNTRSSKFGERKSLAPSTSSLSPKPSGNGISSLSSRKPRVLKAATPLKNQSLVRNAEHKLPNDGKLKEKTLYAIEPKPRKKISSSSTSGSRSFNINGSRSNQSPGRSGSGSDSHGINGSDSNRSPNISGSRSPSIKRSPSNRSPSISGSHSPSINRSPSNRSPSLSGSRSSRTSSYSSSMYSSLSSSQSLCSDEEEEQDYESTPSNGNKSNSSKPKEIKNGNQVTSKAKHQRTRTGMVHSEERDLARKLKFRRGKVVNPEDEINNSRRLRFKQGKVLGDGQNVKGDLKRRIFRKRNDGDKNGTKAESEKVVLRHQDVQVTKDAQGLLNNVIEETASKLVEARKSKVRALVGAFETVISLQETKPAAASTNG